MDSRYRPLFWKKSDKPPTLSKPFSEAFIRHERGEELTEKEAEQVSKEYDAFIEEWRTYDVELKLGKKLPKWCGR